MCLSEKSEMKVRLLRHAAIEALECPRISIHAHLWCVTVYDHPSLSLLLQCRLSHLIGLQMQDICMISFKNHCASVTSVENAGIGDKREKGFLE